MGLNYNTAEDAKSFELIPKNTYAKVKMEIKLGGHNDEIRGWTKGYATRNPSTGSVYLDCKFTILEGKYAKRLVWDRIGLHSTKGPIYAEMGATMIKAILNSARGFKTDDISHEAIQARSIEDFSALDGIVFVALIDIDDKGEFPKNRIRAAIAPEHKEYNKIFNNITTDTDANFGNDDIPWMN
jgi:hypothetical protein